MSGMLGVGAGPVVAVAVAVAAASLAPISAHAVPPVPAPAVSASPRAAAVGAGRQFVPPSSDVHAADVTSAQLTARLRHTPVVIDDALGYSDPQRLRRMGEVLGSAAGRAGEVQVILLTCTPERYAAIPDLRTVRLTA